MSNQEIALELAKAICSGESAPVGTPEQKASVVVQTYKAILNNLNS